MIGWLDCSSGASGDMLLGALIGSGVPLEVIERAVTAVAPERVSVRSEPTVRAGLAATRVVVETADSVTGRSWAEVRRLLGSAELDPTTRAGAMAAFTALARVEAAVHDTAPDRVHFHEVGALDAITDIVGSCAGFTHLGLSQLTCSTVAVGGGTVHTRHGRLPVPVPAVVALLRGVPTVGGPLDTEVCTPTGAAILSTHATGYGRQPEMRVARAGIGAGERDLPGQPNVLRLLVGEPVRGEPVTTTPVLIEANVDDLDPRVWPAVLDRLIAAGASDAWLTPILMKKGRPAHMLSVLAPQELRQDLLRMLFIETSTIGARLSGVERVALQRFERTVEVGGHRVRVKLASHRGTVVNVQPEYEDVAAVARETGRPLRTVLADAAAAARAVR